MFSRLQISLGKQLPQNLAHKDVLMRNMRHLVNDGSFSFYNECVILKTFTMKLL